MLVAALQLGACGLAAFAGARASRRSLRLGTALGLVALLIVLAKFAIAHVPALEANLFPWDFYPLLERWWFHPFVFFLLGAGLHAARRSMWRRDLLLVFGGLLLLRVGDSAWAEVRPQPVLRGVPEESGFCPQTTGYTCGAAAAVFFLHLHGIESTENEMARHCVTRSGLGGTTEAGILRGLRRKGLAARVIAPDEIAAPSIVSVRVNWLVSHFIVVREISDEWVRIADPGQGFYRMERTEFDRVWSGSMIESVEREKGATSSSLPSSPLSSR